MRIIVCGGREYHDRNRVHQVLSSLESPGKRVTHLWHGNARGADTLAAEWGASRNHCAVHATPAEWKKYGKKAGSIRNQKMLGQSPDLVVAFPGGRGTADMVRRADKAGVKVLRIED